MNETILNNETEEKNLSNPEVTAATETEEEDKKKWKKALRRIIMIIILIIIILLLLRKCGRWQGDATELSSTAVETTAPGFNESGKETEASISKTEEAVSVNYVLSSLVTVKDGMIYGLGLENNNESRYIRAVYKLNDEVVYDSKLMAFEQKIDEDHISSEFKMPDDGEYRGVAELYSYDHDSQLRGQTNFNVTFLISK